jgi:hypothetical protein
VLWELREPRINSVGCAGRRGPVRVVRSDRPSPLVGLVGTGRPRVRRPGVPSAWSTRACRFPSSCCRCCATPCGVEATNSLDRGAGSGGDRLVLASEAENLSVEPALLAMDPSVWGGQPRRSGGLVHQALRFTAQASHPRVRFSGIRGTPRRPSTAHLNAPRQIRDVGGRGPARQGEEVVHPTARRRGSIS